MNAAEINSSIFFLMERNASELRSLLKGRLKVEAPQITVDQYLLLRLIYNSEEVSQTMLAEKAFKDPAAITRILDNLERKMLVQRRKSEHDRRAYSVSLTRVGTALINNVHPLISTLQDESLDSLHRRERTVLRGFLRRLHERLESMK